MAYYADNTVEVRAALGREVPVDELRKLHEKRPLLHLLVTGGLVSVLALSIAAIVLIDLPFVWIPFGIVAGFAIFNFTVLLHEVVHRTVVSNDRGAIGKILGILYAVPSGISSAQFTKWHLDHHSNLGSDELDPKRHHLSPKVNERWLKLLYFTPALFFIYFRAAKREAATYPADLQKQIRIERNLTIGFHLTLLALVVAFAGWTIAWKAYLFPYFFVFPIAFATNRVGQHYDIDPADPAHWSTLVRGSRIWDVVFLCSNYHLEHHYFPGVPLYNLPKLQRLLLPFYEKRGFTAKTYPQLLWSYLVENRKPHTDWSGARTADGTAAVSSSPAING
jgi:fatty acid desaturase